MNKKLFIVSLFFLASVQNGFAQTFAWARIMGSSINNSTLPDEGGYGIAVDQSGNSYITGFFTGTVDFDPGPGVFNLSSNGNADIFILKLNIAGSLIWVKQIGTTNNDDGLNILLDGNGNIVITGFFWGTADFDPGIGVSKGQIKKIFF